MCLVEGEKDRHDGVNVVSSGRERQSWQAKPNFLNSTQLCGNLSFSVATFPPVWWPVTQPGMCRHRIKDPWHQVPMKKHKRDSRAKATRHYLFITEGHWGPERRCRAETTQGPGFEDLGWFQWATELSSQAKSLIKNNNNNPLSSLPSTCLIISKLLNKDIIP